MPNLHILVPTLNINKHRWALKLAEKKEKKIMVTNPMTDCKNFLVKTEVHKDGFYTNKHVDVTNKRISTAVVVLLLTGLAFKTRASIKSGFKATVDAAKTKLPTKDAAMARANSALSALKEHKIAVGAVGTGSSSIRKMGH